MKKIYILNHDNDNRIFYELKKIISRNLDIVDDLEIENKVIRYLTLDNLNNIINIIENMFNEIEIIENKINILRNGKKIITILQL